MKNFTQDTKIDDVINYKNFGSYGRLIFPANIDIDTNAPLKNLDNVLLWYSNVNPKKTVEIVNYFKEKADAGEKIFYDIYTDAEKNQIRAKETPACFSSKASQMKNLQFATWAAAFTTSAQCMTVFLTRWNFQNAATTPLH